MKIKVELKKNKIKKIISIRSFFGFDVIFAQGLRWGWMRLMRTGSRVESVFH